MLSGTRLIGGVRRLLINNYVLGELSHFHRGFNVGQVSIALQSSHLLDERIRDIGLSCCGGCTNAENCGYYISGCQYVIQSVSHSARCRGVGNLPNQAWY